MRRNKAETSEPTWRQLLDWSMKRLHIYLEMIDWSERSHWAELVIKQPPWAWRTDHIHFSQSVSSADPAVINSSGQTEPHQSWTESQYWTITDEDSLNLAATDFSLLFRSPEVLRRHLHVRTSGPTGHAAVWFSLGSYHGSEPLTVLFCLYQQKIDKSVMCEFVTWKLKW